jgi:hypothetical protein
MAISHTDQKHVAGLLNAKDAKLPSAPGKQPAAAALIPKPLAKNNEIEIVTAPALHAELTVVLNDEKSNTYKIFQKYLEQLNDPENSIYLLGAQIETRNDKSIRVSLQDASPLNIVFKETELAKIEPIAAWKAAAFIHPMPAQPEDKLLGDAKDTKQDRQMIVRDIELLEQDAPIKAQQAVQQRADDWQKKYWIKALDIIELAKKDDTKLEAFKLILGPELYRVNQELSNELYHNYFATKESEVKKGFYEIAYLIAEVYENKLYYAKVWEEYNTQFIKLIPEKIRKLNAAISWLNDFAVKIGQKELVQPMINDCLARIKYYKDTNQNFIDLKQEFISIYQAFEKQPDMNEHDFRFDKIQSWIKDCARKLPASAREPIQLNGKQKADFEKLLENSLKYIVRESIEQLRVQYKDFSKRLAFKQGLPSVQMKTNFIDPMLTRHEEALTTLSEKFFLNSAVRSFQDDMSLTRLRENLLQIKQTFTEEYNTSQLKQQKMQDSIEQKESEVTEKFRVTMTAWYTNHILRDDDHNPQGLVEEVIESGIGSISINLIKDPATGNTLMHELMLSYKTADNQRDKKRILNLIEVLYAHGADPYVLNLAGKNAFDHAEVHLNSTSDWRLIALDLKYAITFSDFAESTRKQYAQYTNEAANASFFERLFSNEQINLQRLNRMSKISAAISQSTRNIDDNALIEELRRIVSAESKKDWPKGMLSNSKVAAMAKTIIQGLDEKRLIAIGPNMQIQVSELKDKVQSLQAARDELERKYQNIMSRFSVLEGQGLVIPNTVANTAAFFQPNDEKSAMLAPKQTIGATAALPAASGAAALLTVKK